MIKKNQIKFIVSFISCLLIRLLPFRAPNVEPILSLQMPMAKKFGLLSSFAFGFLSISVYDAILNKIGIWTLVTGVAYGALGALAYAYFKKREASRRNFVKFAVIGTLLYDAVTGLAMGPLLFGQSFSVALAGQVPFTLLHLLGSITFAYFLSPVFYKWFASEKSFNFASIINNSLSVFTQKSLN